MASSQADPLVGAAQHLAEELLTALEGRRLHIQGVARRAALAAPAVPRVERATLVAAAWLHDIGYAAPLRRTGFHPIDGAWFLHEQGWPDLIVGLVAQHSGARFVAEVRGLSALIAPFADSRYVEGPLADALTFADQTTGPDGAVVDVEHRMADMLRRQGADSANAQCHHLRAPVLRAAVFRTELRLLAGWGAPRDQQTVTLAP